LSLHRNAPPSFERSLIEELQQRTGYHIEPGPLLATFKHSVTRYRIELFCFTAQKKNGRARRSEQLDWISLDRIDEVPMSVTGRKFAKRLQEPGLFG
jgi:A/G-specific adenine glycosylase